MNNVLLGGATRSPTAARSWVHYETIGGGQGGRPWADGMSGVHTAMTNTLDTPVEALERALPLRVRRYGLRRGSGGAGIACGRRRHLARARGPRAHRGVADHRAPGHAAARSRGRRAGRGGGELAAPGR